MEQQQRFNSQVRLQPLCSQLHHRGFPLLGAGTLLPGQQTSWEVGEGSVAKGRGGEVFLAFGPASLSP